MYHYVEDKNFINCVQSCCRDLLEKTRQLLYKEYELDVEFILVGSGGRNLITQNEKESIDFDYNANVKNYDCNEKKLKDTFKKALNLVFKKRKLDDWDDSTSALQSKNMHLKNQPNI